MPGAALLEKLDAAIAALIELRAELADVLKSEEISDTDNLAPEHLLDTTSASQRFNFPRDTLAKWCREEGLGVRQGGRWLVSIPKLQRRINGK
jgi:hypothetical protein